MFLILQFPFGDLRGFAESNRRLQNPTWPEPSNWQYVHSVGGIKQRNRPGLLNWIGETKFCSADNAIKFSGEKADFELGNGINFRVSFRRFFFDGRVSGKFEIGLRVNFTGSSVNLNADGFAGLLKKLFLHPVRIPGQNDGRSVSLINAGRFLAALYCVSSSTRLSAEESLDNERLIRAGSPLLFIETSVHEKISHRQALRVAGLDVSKVRLSHLWLNKAKICTRDVRCWIMHDVDEQSDYARELRIALLRLNASRVGLQAVVDGLLKKLAVPGLRTEASQRLQHYLNRVAEQCLKIPDEFKESNVLQIAYQSERVITASSVIVLMKMLRDEIDVRGQVVSKMEKLLGAVVELGQQNCEKVEIVMGDKYVAKQVGAQGPNAQAHNMTFNQILLENGNAVDLPKLAGELERLRTELAPSAKTSEHFAEIGAIASAEMEAQKGNGEKAVEALSKTGKWSLGVAEKIGVGLATAVIKTSLGL
jgi:hypothetical protein